jgi:hypothetical protein
MRKNESVNPRRTRRPFLSNFSRSSGDRVRDHRALRSCSESSPQFLGRRLFSACGCLTPRSTTPPSRSIPIGVEGRCASRLDPNQPERESRAGLPTPPRWLHASFRKQSYVDTTLVTNSLPSIGISPAWSHSKRRRLRPQTLLQMKDTFASIRVPTWTDTSIWSKPGKPPGRQRGYLKADAHVAGWWNSYP